LTLIAPWNVQCLLVDELRSYGDDTLRLLAAGTFSPAHASSFCGYVKIVRNRFSGERQPEPTAPAWRSPGSSGP
jgi:hypothetical protein